MKFGQITYCREVIERLFSVVGDFADLWDGDVDGGSGSDVGMICQMAWH